MAHTFCDACNQIPFCGVRVHLREGRIVGMEGWEGHPNNRLCAKAYATVQEEYHPDRLLYPMIRVGPKDSAPRWRTATWDEALDLIAGRLREVRDKYGPESVLFYVGDPKEPRLAVSRLASAFGSPNFGTESSTCSRAASLASQLLFGLRAWGTPPSELTRGVVIWAMNPAWTSSPSLRRLIEAKRRGAKFLVVDPRRTPTSERLADLHLRPRPGTDGALALGMINVVIREGLYDRDFVERWVHGFEELRAYASRFTPEEVERITWVPAGEVEEAAELLAGSRPETILLGYSTLTHTTNGVQNVRAILTLMAILGNIDVPGGIVIPTRPPLPYLAMTDYPLRAPGDVLSMGVDFALMRRKVELRDRRADADRFPVWAELVPEQIQVNMLPEYVREGRIRAALLFGANLTMWPQYREYQEAIRSLEFAAAVDYFYRPWTHDFVDVVLPAATMYEREEPFAVYQVPGGWRIYRRERVLEPRGEARPDWWIAFQIAVRLGLGDLFWGGDTRAAMDWILRRSVGVGYDEIPVPDGLLVPSREAFRKYERGLLREDGRPGFPTPTGKVEVWSTVLEKYGFDPLPTYREPEESPLSRPDLAARYPLVLITGSRSPVYTHSKHRELSWLREMEPEPLARISPRDAAARGIRDGDPVVVETPHGSLRMRARVTHMMPPGVVDVPHGWASVPGANANDATPRSFDPISGYPSFKALLCEVRRAERGGAHVPGGRRRVLRVRGVRGRLQARHRGRRLDLGPAARVGGGVQARLDPLRVRPGRPPRLLLRGEAPLRARLPLGGHIALRAGRGPGGGDPPPLAPPRGRGLPEGARAPGRGALPARPGIGDTQARGARAQPSAYVVHAPRARLARRRLALRQFLHHGLYRLLRLRRQGVQPGVVHLHAGEPRQGLEDLLGAQGVYVVAGRLPEQAYAVHALHGSHGEYQAVHAVYLAAVHYLDPGLPEPVQELRPGSRAVDRPLGRLPPQYVSRQGVHLDDPGIPGDLQRAVDDLVARLVALELGGPREEQKRPRAMLGVVYLEARQVGHAVALYVHLGRERGAVDLRHELCL